MMQIVTRMVTSRRVQSKPKCTHLELNIYDLLTRVIPALEALSTEHRPLQLQLRVGGLGLERVEVMMEVSLEVG